MYRIINPLKIQHWFSNSKTKTLKLEQEDIFTDLLDSGCQGTEKIILTDEENRNIGFTLKRGPEGRLGGSDS